VLASRCNSTFGSTPTPERVTVLHWSGVPGNDAAIWNVGACGREKGMARKLNRTPSNPPLGLPVPSWSQRQLPPLGAMSGQFCRVEPIDSARHGEALYAAYAADREGRLWTHLPWGPYSGPEELCAQIDAVRASGARPEYALIDLASGKPLGQASYLNIDPAAGSIEVGGIVYAPAFQRGIAATEAMYLMMRHAFDELSYRRYAWQCNSLNAKSRTAAIRLGFIFEGVWRQANVHKGRNRDTAWFSILDGEWPAIKTAFERWLAPENFDAEGRQRMRLSVLTAAAHRS
jgi:RimJ/RimL family protein N-acetyltransferase